MNARTTILLTTIVLLAIALGAGAEAQTPTHKPGGFHSPDIPTGQSWNHTFTQAGMYYYHCHPHPFMQGTVEVKEGASTSPATIEARGYKFVPDKIVVGPGTTVTWTNRDPAPHTVDESVPPEKTEGGSSPAPPIAIVLGAILLLVLSGRARQE